MTPEETILEEPPQEVSPLEVPATPAKRPLPTPGYACISNFNVRIEQLPEDIGVVDVDALVAQIRTNCMELANLSEQEAIRLLMGCNFDLGDALHRERTVVAWR